MLKFESAVVCFWISDSFLNVEVTSPATEHSKIPPG